MKGSSLLFYALGFVSIYVVISQVYLHYENKFANNKETLINNIYQSAISILRSGFTTNPIILSIATEYYLTLGKPHVWNEITLKSL